MPWIVDKLTTNITSMIIGMLEVSLISGAIPWIVNNLTSAITKDKLDVSPMPGAIPWFVNKLTTNVTSSYFRCQSHSWSNTLAFLQSNIQYVFMIH